MKKTRSFLLTILLLASSHPVMAVDDNVWQEPSVTEFAELTEGEVYYFYLADCRLFFTQGNAYGTQASAGTLGLKVRVERRSDGAWTLTDYVRTQNAWKMWWFVNNQNIMFVDYNNQPDYLWEIKNMGGLTYRLSPSSLNPNCRDNTKFVGLDRTADPENTALYYGLTAESGAYIDWKLVPEAAYEVYEAALMIYDAAMELKDLLNKAESIGTNVTAQIAVYNNTNSTLEEIQKAIEETKAAITAREEEIAWERYDTATAEAPADITPLFITNPSFAGNSYDGWEGTGFGGYLPKENAERYNMNYDTYQRIEGLKEGVYVLSVNAFYRAGIPQPAYDNFKVQNGESRYAKLYTSTSEDSLTASIVSPFTAKLTENMATGTWRSAIDSETGETFVIPNNMEAADEFFKAGYCNGNSVFIYVEEKGDLRIGVRKDMTVPDDWTMFDDFSLIYYGDGDDAYTLLLESVKKNAGGYDPTADVITWSYMSAYNEAVAGLGMAVGKEPSIGAMRDFQNARDSLDRNIQLWKDLASVWSEVSFVVHSLTDMEDDDLACQLLEWLDTTYGQLVEERTLTNGELEEEIATINEWYLEVLDRHLQHTGLKNVDGIKMVKAESYTIDGRRLASPPEKGVYILDGKKYMK